MSKLEYLNPADWSLHVIDGENEGVPKGWLLVPKLSKFLTLSPRLEHTFWVDEETCWNESSNKWMYTTIYANAVGGNSYYDYWKNKIVWQRESKSEVVEDVVNQPSHYNKGGVECIDAIESSMTKEAFCGYLKGNVQKYMWRYENKGGVESLKKAQWYLNKLIEVEGK